MKIKKTLIFRLLSIFILIAFICESSLISSTAYAEVPCWNDGYIDYAYGGDPSLGGGPNPRGSQNAGDPVNVATGNYAYENTDFTIPSRGDPIEFNRFYNSQDGYDGPLGIGWSHNYNIFLVEVVGGSGENYVIRRNPEGDKDEFRQNPDGTYSAPQGVFDTLTKEGQNYVIITKHGTSYRFNSTGYLTSITDRNQNQIILTYDSETGVLTKVADALGRFILFEYNSGQKLSKIIDFTGRTWRYVYANGDLISVTIPSTTEFPFGTTTTYTHNEHNLSSITDAKGNTYLSITYDSVDRVDTMTQGMYSYDFNYSPGFTTVYDRRGNWTDYALNADGTTNKMTQSLTHETSYTYNSAKLITKIVYPKGNSIEYIYDNKGNRLEIRRKPNAGSNQADIVTTFTYEHKYNFIKTLTDPKGYTVTCYYDYEEAILGDLNQDGITTQAQGNLVKIAEPQVAEGTPEAKFTYNSVGQIEKVIDSDGSATKYEYYPLNSYLHKVIQDLGGLNFVSEMTYDLVGNAKTIKDPKGNTTTFEYDSHNNRTKTVSAAPFNYITTYKYDANDNLVQEDRQTDNPGNPWQSTYYTYDSLDKLQTIRDDLGNTTAYSYDANDNLASIKDAELNSNLYEYDERNLLSKVTDAEGNTAEYTYGRNRNLEEIKDAKGNTTTYTYDDLDRLIKITYADNSTEEYTYDANYNLTYKIDPKRQIFYYEYDSLNRMTQKGLFPKGSNPESEVTYVYDLGSKLTSVSDSTGTATYAYDNSNRLTQVTYPGPKSVSYEYDANSNRKKLTYPDSSYITYEYDSLDRPTAIKNESGNSISSYSHDALFRRTQANYANNTQALYQYDAVDRMTKLTNQLTNQPTNKISEFVYTYDKIYNRESMTTLSGIHNYTYDKIYQLKTVDYPSGYTFPDTTFNYDAAGNRISSVNGGTTNYTANSLNQYTQVGGATYAYDSNGNLTSDGTFTYTYDYENRLTSATKTGTTATYKYNTFGRRIEKTVNGITTRFLYDGEHIIAEYDTQGNLKTKYIYGPAVDEPIKGLSPTGTVPEWYYHYDGLGSVTNLTDSSGTVLESYSYDAYGRPQIGSSLGNRFMFTGREFDEETGLYYYRARHYSPVIGRFLERDPLGYIDDNINLYTYVGNNPLNWVDPYGWSKRNRDLLDAASDFCAGWGDGLTYGGTGLVRELFGYDYIVDKDSGSYLTGQVVAVVHSAAMGKAVQTAGAKAPGKVFSHWIPDRTLKKFGLENSRLGKSILNGNYVTPARHYYHDPHAVMKGWTHVNNPKLRHVPKWNPVRRQFDRIPNVYKKGAAYGAAGKTEYDILDSCEEEE